MAESFDVIVIGGGPAGSFASGFLARAGFNVLLLEKERFPRYHIGESLLSASLPLLEMLGVMPAIEEAGFVRKPGGTFVWGSTRAPWSFYFREDPGGQPYAFHVLRSQFDHILLRHAAALGVDVREQHRVRGIQYDGRVRVEIEDDTGRAVVAASAWVVDASGQSAMLGQRDGLREFNPFFKNLAVFGYFDGAEPLSGPVAGNILSAAFNEGWFWFIPLHDGTTSVGAVVDAQRLAAAASGDPAALYRRLVDACAPVAQRVREGRLVSPIRVIRDYSYCSRRFYGPGYLLVGDAACFIDPVFSTGVHLACLSGYLAARALRGISEDGEQAAWLADYDARYRSAFERYLEFLYYFYDHHSDPDSYFWQARKILNPDAELDTRTAFIRLMSGGADLTSSERDAGDALAARNARLTRATSLGRFAAAPGAELFRVRSTLEVIRDSADGPQGSRRTKRT